MNNMQKHFKRKSLRDAVVRGPGTGTSDSVTAKVSTGEAILPAKTVKAIGGQAAVKHLVKSTTGKAPKQTLRSGAKYAVGLVQPDGTLSPTMPQYTANQPAPQHPAPPVRVSTPGPTFNGPAGALGVPDGAQLPKPAGPAPVPAGVVAKHQVQATELNNRAEALKSKLELQRLNNPPGIDPNRFGPSAPPKSTIPPPATTVGPNASPVMQAQERLLNSGASVKDMTRPAVPATPAAAAPAAPAAQTHLGVEPIPTAQATEAAKVAEKPGLLSRAYNFISHPVDSITGMVRGDGATKTASGSSAPTEAPKTPAEAYQRAIEAEQKAQKIAAEKAAQEAEKKALGLAADRGTNAAKVASRFIDNPEIAKGITALREGTGDVVNAAKNWGGKALKSVPKLGNALGAGLEYGINHEFYNDDKVPMRDKAAQVALNVAGQGAGTLVGGLSGALTSLSGPGAVALGLGTGAATDYAVQKGILKLAGREMSPAEEYRKKKEVDPADATAVADDKIRKSASVAGKIELPAIDKNQLGERARLDTAKAKAIEAARPAAIEARKGAFDDAMHGTWSGVNPKASADQRFVDSGNAGLNRLADDPKAMGAFNTLQNARGNGITGKRLANGTVEFSGTGGNGGTAGGAASPASFIPETVQGSPSRAGSQLTTPGVSTNLSGLAKAYGGLAQEGINAAYETREANFNLKQQDRMIRQAQYGMQFEQNMAERRAKQFDALFGPAGMIKSPDGKGEVLNEKRAVAERALNALLAHGAKRTGDMSASDVKMLLDGIGLKENIDKLDESMFTKLADMANGHFAARKQYDDVTKYLPAAGYDSGIAGQTYMDRRGYRNSVRQAQGGDFFGIGGTNGNIADTMEYAKANAEAADKRRANLKGQ